MNATQTTRTTAAQLRARLEAAGICPDRVTLERSTGRFVVTFNDRDRANIDSRGIQRADVYARAVEAAFADVHVADWRESIADHRPYRPVTSVLLYVNVGGLPFAIGGTE